MTNKTNPEITNEYVVIEVAVPWPCSTNGAELLAKEFVKKERPDLNVLKMESKDHYYDEEVKTDDGTYRYGGEVIHVRCQKKV